MNPNIQFFPLCKKCKMPHGAAAVGEEIFLRIEFARPSNPESVFVVLTKDAEDPVRYEMERGETSVDGWVEYKRKLSVTSRGLYYYHFIIETQSEQYYVGRDESLHAMLGKGAEWQLTVYDKAIATPDWQWGGIYYQIMPDRFFIGGQRQKTKRDVVYRDDWGGTPQYRPDKDGKIRNNDLFGGNLKGITKKLSYIKSLGVTCIYLNPIFEARSNHKYDTGSYRRVDSDFGSIGDLKELIQKAGRKGIRIMLDGVFSHTGDDSIYFNKYGSYDSIGAYQSPDSPYAGWYSVNRESGAYESWWGIETLPNTVEENPGFTEFVTGEDGVIRSWTELGLGGWRLDVADELPDGFLDKAARAAKAKDPTVLFLGEVWEDASNKTSYGRRRRYLNGGQLDSVTNYPFKEDILNFVMTGDAKKLADTVHHIVNNYPKAVLDNLMNLLGTHDTARLLTVLGDSGKTVTRAQRAEAKLVNRDAAIARLRLATVLQYTLPGVPCVYYGDEAGMEGFEDPFNRRCYPWENQDKAVLRWYKKLGKIRLENRSVFAQGRFKLISAGGGVFAFERRGEKESVFVVVNNGKGNFGFERDEDLVDLLTNKLFKGAVKPGEAVVLKISLKD